MENRFDDRTAVVTGAGSGIGRAVALRLAGEGARVVAADVRPDRVEAVVAELRDQGGPEPVGVVGDVADQAHVDEPVAAAGERVDVLANVAGIMDGFLPVDELDDDTWERVLAVNLTAPMRLTRAVVPAMVRAGRGTIVNVASEAALRGSTSGTAYTTSKHGLIGLTRSTAVLYRHAGVRCNAVCPGPVATNIEAASRSDATLETLMPYLAIVPPAATPEELAAAVCWLASDDSSNITGVVLASDGGWSAL